MVIKKGAYSGLGKTRMVGIGLIEVLVTLVVTAFGLLAIASFQGSLISESTLTKARNEALMYCESGLNEYRNTISTSAFASLAEPSPNPQTYTGTVGTYSRTISIASGAVGVNGIKVTASCTDSAGILSGPIELSTVISPKDLVLEALGPAGDGDQTLSNLSPSLNAGSSDDIAEVINIADSLDRMESADVVKWSEGTLVSGDVIQITNDDGSTDLFVVDTGGLTASFSVTCSDPSVNALPFENGLYAKRYDYYTDQSDFYKYYRIDLFEALETAADGVRCIPRVRYNGGVIIPITGVIHSGRDSAPYLEVDLFTLNISESGTFCVFEPNDGATSAPYACYVGGNCANDTDLSSASQNFGTDNSDFKQCPEAPSTDEQIAAQALAHTAIKTKSSEYYVGEGGWRGNVGLLNIASDVSSDGYNVCFLEDLDGSYESRNTARFYYTANTDGDSDTISEGLNKPYACQDFLIMDVFQGNDRFFPDACSSTFSTKFPDLVESKTVFRDLVSGAYISNTYDSEIQYYSSCTGSNFYSLSGSLTGAYGIPEVRVTDGVINSACQVYDDPDSATEGDLNYTCEFTTREPYVVITATQDSREFPNSTDNSDSEMFWCNNASVTPSDADVPCNIQLPARTGEVYTVNGTVSGSSEGLDNLVALVSDSSLNRTDISYGCFVDGVLNTFACEFSISASAAAVSYTLSPEVYPGYEIISDHSTERLFGTDTTTVQSDIGRVVEIGTLGSETLSGSITNNSGYTPISLVINSSQFVGSCTIDDSSYSCAIPSNATGVAVTYTISVPNPACTGTGNGAKKLELFATDATGTLDSSTDGTATVELDLMNGPRSVNITFDKASGSGSGCSD